MHQIASRFLLLIALSPSLLAQQTISAGTTEFVFGLGALFPKELTPLNVQGEHVLSSVVTGHLAVRKYVGDLASVGVRGSIAFHKLPDYTVTTTDNPTPRSTEFTLNRYNVALEGMLLLTDYRFVRPYLLIMGGYSTGTLTNKDFGTLNLYGFFTSVGAGIRVEVSKSTALTIEGLHMKGEAQWKHHPFENSDGRNFDLDSFQALVCVWYHID